MKMEWLRQLSLAALPGELVETLEALAAREMEGEAAYWAYHPPTWSLRRKGHQRGLDDDCLESRCLLQGAVQTAEQSAFEGSTRTWPRVVALPVRRFGSLLGVLVVGGAQEPRADELERLGEAYAMVAAPLAELFRSRQALSQFQELAVAAVESLDGVRSGHVAAVCQLTADLADYLDFSPQARRRLWNAALFHDLGRPLLRRLGNAEMDRTHPRSGADFLAASDLYSDLAPLVATHHERYDGSGFPDGLAGDQLTADQWVLGLAEDLDEFNELNQHLGFEVRMGIFFHEKARGHHPEVLDALAGLIDSGRLDRLR